MLWRSPKKWIQEVKDTKLNTRGRFTHSWWKYICAVTAESWRFLDIKVDLSRDPAFLVLRRTVPRSETPSEKPLLVRWRHGWERAVSTVCSVCVVSGFLQSLDWTLLPTLLLNRVSDWWDKKSCLQSWARDPSWFQWAGRKGVRTDARQQWVWGLGYTR